jgi:preprotein translocase subunit SecB
MAEDQRDKGANASANTSRRFSIEKLYLKDVSFESPNSPAVFTSQWSPQIQYQLNTRADVVAEDTHEVVLSVTVTAKQGDQTGFLAEVHQAGIFRMEGFSQEELTRIVAIECPTVLFPFAREAISDLVLKGGFPPVILTPMNFHALYAQHAQTELKAAGQGPTPH